MIKNPIRCPETAHVLFMDLVSYSRLSLEEQARRCAKLRKVVRSTLEFKRGEEKSELLSLDTGDGVAILFFRDPTSPLQCALEVAAAISEDPDMALRMGIHTGPVSRVEDINGRVNVVGGGINFAQRVMDCGEARHILLSNTSAEMVREFENWSTCLHDLGECEVKHGAKLHLYNFYINGVGNPERPKRAAPRATQTKDPDVEGFEPTGGAVPLGSRYYLERQTDPLFRDAVLRGDSLVLVKGPRQMGKTSLLARGLQQARESGARVVLTDLQKLNSQQLESADTVFKTLAETILDQLDLDVDIASHWSPQRGWNVNFERLIRKEVLGAFSCPVVWALDEVDRLFTCSFGSEVFGLFRSWHNERSLDPSGPWSRLTLAIAYATEAHLFITDLNQSPFNVGTRLTLADFSTDEIADLNSRFGSPLTDRDQLARYGRLVGGHPYLTHRGLEQMASRPMSLEDVEALAGHEDGPFADHLRRLQFTLERDPLLSGAVRGVLTGRHSPSDEAFFRLRSAGVLVGEGPLDARLRCGLYEAFLADHLR